MYKKWCTKKFPLFNHIGNLLNGTHANGNDTVRVTQAPVVQDTPVVTSGAGQEETSSAVCALFATPISRCSLSYSLTHWSTAVQSHPTLGTMCLPATAAAIWKNLPGQFVLFIANCP